eukprot:jgi/Picsp_1/6431/NSC_03779-R1_solute carrier family 25 member 38
MASEKPKRKSKLASVVSGAASGALVSACVQPLDVIRTRLQADSAKGQLLSTVSTIRLIIRNHGVRSLWQGTQPTVVRLGVGAGLHFFFLESLKPLFEKTGANDAQQMGAMGAVMTGGLSRAMAALISCPITVVKTRMEYIDGSNSRATPMYKNTTHALRTIAKQEGIRGMYKGLGPTILSNAPFSAIYYLFYTRLQSRLSQADMPTMMVNFSSSTVAAVAATLITQPADVVRTRMQLNMEQVAVAGQRASTLSIMRGILSAQGTRGLLAGAAPRMIKRTVQTALVWTLYEELMPRLSTVVYSLGAAKENNVSS